MRRDNEEVTSAGHAQWFLSAFSGISPHFRRRRHLLSAEEYRREMDTRFTTWNGDHRHGHRSRLSAAPEIDPTAQSRFHVFISGPKFTKLMPPRMCRGRASQEGSPQHD